MEKEQINPTTNDGNVGVLESGSDSGAVQSTRRKRKTDISRSGSEIEAIPGSKCHTATRGRPPKARGAAQTRARKQQRQRVEKAREKDYDLERSLSDWASQHKSAQTDVESVSGVDDRRDAYLCSAEELRKFAGQRAASILQVAMKSGNLKGTYVRKLKEAAASLTEIVEALVTRTENEEVRRVREENQRLTVEVEKLRSELQAHSKEVQSLRLTVANSQNSAQAVSAPTHDVNEEMLEGLKRTIISSVGTLIDARFAGIEERLLPARPLRPPLAHERRQRGMAISMEIADAETEAKRKPKHKKPTGRVQAPVARNDALMAETCPESGSGITVAEIVEEVGGSWTTVVKRSKKGKKSSSTPTSAAANRQPPRPKLAKPPRTKAVMVTLTTEALRKGVSYAQALERAQQGIDLVQLGITQGLTVRQAMSGARLLELSASYSSEQADILAERLGVVLEGVAEVTRPHKNASLRLVGLDDSVTKERVMDAVASTGGCPVNAITVSDLLLGPRGMRSAVVRCPCESAKIIVEKGRILVGWSSAKVQVLEERPMRCFRCLSLGHTRPRCPSTVVREHLCFRCGSEGHKFKTCQATPRCMVCLDAKKPAEHVMGSADCHPPPVEGTEALNIEAYVRRRGCEGQEDIAMS